ncbi:hypothetical protein cypCar_00011538, partial [Cyprinus carpio]
TRNCKESRFMTFLDRCCVRRIICAFSIFLYRFLAHTCAICEQLILPNKGSNEIVARERVMRVMSKGKSYHVACYEGKSNI